MNRHFFCSTTSLALQLDGKYVSLGSRCYPVEAAFLQQRKKIFSPFNSSEEIGDDDDYDEPTSKRIRLSAVERLVLLTSLPFPSSYVDQQHSNLIHSVQWGPY